MQCWVWLGCDGFSWIMDLYSGSWWVSVMIRLVGFAIWYRWVLISVVLIDFGGFWILVAGFVGWSGWLWVLGVGWLRWFRDMGWSGLFWVLLWFCDSLILWLWMWRIFFFPLSAVVCGCGDGGWMWWLWNGWVDMVAGDAGLWKRDTEERESEKERGKIKKNKKW